MRWATEALADGKHARQFGRYRCRARFPLVSIGLKAGVRTAVASTKAFARSTMVGSERRTGCSTTTSHWPRATRNDADPSDIGLAMFLDGPDACGVPNSPHHIPDFRLGLQPRREACWTSRHPPKAVSATCIMICDYGVVVNDKIPIRFARLAKSRRFGAVQTAPLHRVCYTPALTAWQRRWTTTAQPPRSGEHWYVAYYALARPTPLVALPLPPCALRWTRVSHATPVQTADEPWWERSMPPDVLRGGGSSGRGSTPLSHPMVP